MYRIISDNNRVLYVDPAIVTVIGKHNTNECVDLLVRTWDCNMEYFKYNDYTVCNDNNPDTYRRLLKQIPLATSRLAAPKRPL
jgi:hypothetical protein